MRTVAPKAIARLVATVLVVALIVPAAGPVFAAPVTNAAIQARQKQAQAAEARLQDLQADLEERAEEYAEVEAALERTSADLARTQVQLDKATARLGAARARLSRRAVSIYRGGRPGILDVLVGVRDFSELAARVDLMGRIGRSDAATVAEVKQAKKRVERAEAALENRRAEQVVLRERAGVKKAQVAEAMAAQKAYLGTIRRDIARLIAEERERQRRIAEERARRAAAAAAAAARAARERAARQRAATNSLTLQTATPGQPHPEVVPIAMRYLGVPYRWGGTTPDGFDCSGLCQYVYAQIGIDLPRNSRAQFGVGALIPADRRDLLRPGDLVFFGRQGDPNRIHHVGIYAGDGDFIEAPFTGGVVRVASLDERIASRGDYVGAVRP